MYDDENEYNVELGKFDSFNYEIDIEYVIILIVIISIILWSLL